MNIGKMQTKNKPERVLLREDGLWECPVCGAVDQHGHNYCDQCGQRLDWSGWDKQYREWNR